MFDFSIELQAENIHDKRTREYFQEVLSSFINGNYRSALVMLWTVTVTDIIFKLQHLDSIYNDETAREILKEIENIQNKNPNPADWERKLIELIKKRKLSTFELYELIHVESLQKDRHLAAHPIIKDGISLYQPNKETVRASIRNIMEGVLIKSPYASNKIFYILIKDISEKRDLFPSYKKLVDYIDAAYLKSMPLGVINHVFKKLWKFSFLLENSDADLNREINVRVLGVISKKYLIEMVNLVKDENHYFSINIALNNDSIMGVFVEYCSSYSKIYHSIDESYISPIKEKITTDHKLHSLAPFLYTKIDDFIDAIENKISYKEFCKNELSSKLAYDYFESYSNTEKLLDSYITAFSSSGSFDIADIRYIYLIEPFLENFNEKQFIKIIESIDENDQINSRRRARSTNSKIKESIENKKIEIDFSDYKYILFNE